MNNPSISERQSNIELCRIFAILLVVLVHTNFAWTGVPHELENPSPFRFFVQAFSIIGVNVFILITGYFSTSIKPKSLFNLFYICLFYGIVRIICGIVTNNLIVKDLFFISSSNWFIISYLGLVLLTPLLNSVAAKSALLKWGGVLLIYEVYFGFFPALQVAEPGINHGYSVLSFAVLYLIGRYIKLYGLPKCIKNYSFYLYIGISLLLGFTAYLLFKKSDVLRISPSFYTRVYDYVNPAVIFSSICFFQFFEKMEIKSRIINHISRSTLAVLLVHGAAVINPPMIQYFKSLIENYSDKIVLLSLFWFLGILGICLISVLIDQIRIYSYKLIALPIYMKIESKIIHK